MLGSVRAAAAADRPAVIALALAEEISWFGEPENTPEEIGEFIDATAGVVGGIVVARDDGTLRGFASVGSAGEAWLVIDPADPAPPYAALAAWLREHKAGSLYTYGADEPRHRALEASGWRAAYSSYDLARPGAEPVDRPRWPSGVSVVDYEARRDAHRVHELIYVDARWADVPGHLARDLDSWSRFYGTHDRGWVALRDDKPIGAVFGRVAADGRGVVHQIAVATDERRQGLGRALLLHAFAVFLAHGATSLALGVQAANTNALRLYRAIGLEVAREWRIYQPV
jgi:ribosomal protein S18 acetylase RimI-like enzyme